jgi:hypothetical protein
MSPSTPTFSPPRSHRSHRNLNEHRAPSKLKNRVAQLDRKRARRPSTDDTQKKFFLSTASYPRGPPSFPHFVNGARGGDRARGVVTPPRARPAVRLVRPLVPLFRSRHRAPSPLLARRVASPLTSTSSSPRFVPSRVRRRRRVVVVARASASASASASPPPGRATSPLSQPPADAPVDPRAALRGVMIHRASDGELVDVRCVLLTLVPIRSRRRSER